MKYRCLVLDHDDTVVNSTATIHYPSFVAYMDQYHPEIHYSLEEYFRYNFDPGVTGFFTDLCGLSPEELIQEEAYWAQYADSRTAKAYAGLREILLDHKKMGGYICVSSHSFSKNILRDYEVNDLPMPDLCFGWELPPAQRKPAPYTLYKIMEAFHLEHSQILMVDDLKPGYDMARAAGVDFAAAGWANDIPEIRQFMQKNCDYYCKTPGDLRKVLDL